MRLIGNVILLSVTMAGVGCSSDAPPQASSSDKAADLNARVPEHAKERAIAAKDVLFSKLSGRLMEVMQADGPVKAIEVCSKEANEIAQSVSKTEGVNIGRTSLKLRNPENQPPAWVEKLYTQSPHEPQFAFIDKMTVGAVLPIKLQAKCLMCHGQKEALAPGVPEQLAKLYPEDQATGFNEGDLRGWFWVQVPVENANDENSQVES